MPEPVAAAVAYGLHKKENVHHILVFDFGGGTLDVSILYVQKGSIEVVANGGDNDLGGTDFDGCIADDLTKQVNAVASSTDCDDFVTTEPCEPHVLNNLPRDEGQVSSVDTVQESARGTADRRVRTILTKQRFEKTCAHLFQRAPKTVDDTLTNGMLMKKDVTMWTRGTSCTWASCCGSR